MIPLPTSSASKLGVLLINLGSPDSTSVADVRKYLREFLMDPRVLDVPWPVRWCLVHLAILPRRPAQSAEPHPTVGPLSQKISVQGPQGPVSPMDQKLSFSPKR